MAREPPKYEARVADKAECELLCEADALCDAADVSDQDSQLCEVHGKEAAGGAPTPEGSLQPFYSAGDGAAREAESKSASSEKPWLRWGRPERTVLLMTYASGEIFQQTQRLMDESLHIAEIVDHLKWNESEWQSGERYDWYHRHDDVNFPRGGAWKPYLIWQAFRQVKWGDWLIYHDSSRYYSQGFSSSVQPLLEWLEENREENPCECLPAVQMRATLEHEWTQKCVAAYGAQMPKAAFEVFCDVLTRLDLCGPERDTTCCEYYWQQPTHQHSWSVWRKNRRSARLLREWAKWSENYNTLAQLPLVDQSLISLLFYRFKKQLGLRSLWVPRLFQNAWNQDADIAVGRWDGAFHKHLNFVLDTLVYEKYLHEKKYLFLVDPEEMRVGVHPFREAPLWRREDVPKERRRWMNSTMRV
eukprot:s204_g6.t2